MRRSFPELVPLTGGGYVADTPGLKAFVLWDVEPDELDGYFREIAPLVSECAFSDCTHVHEPGCAVIQAVEDGRIDPGRYELVLTHPLGGRRMTAWRSKRWPGPGPAGDRCRSRLGYGGARQRRPLLLRDRPYPRRPFCVLLRRPRRRGDSWVSRSPTRSSTRPAGGGSSISRTPAWSWPPSRAAAASGCAWRR